MSTTSVAPDSNASTSKSGMMLRLYQLADSLCGDFSYETGRFQPLKGSMHSPKLYRLAVELTLRSLHLDKDLLSVFCEPDAVKLLMRMPNRYWFWSTIRKAVLQNGDDSSDTLLTEGQVARALVEIRREVAYKYDLRLPLAELSQAQIASRALAGVILVKSCFAGDNDEIVFNPIFAPLPSIGGTVDEVASALTAALLKD